MTKHVVIAMVVAALGCGSTEGDPIQDPDGGSLQEVGPGEDAAVQEDAAFDTSDTDKPDTGKDAPVDAVVPLEILEVEPKEGEGVPRNRPVRILFPDPILRSTLSVEINGQPVLLVSADDMEFRYTPLHLFAAETDYTVRTAAGLTDVNEAVLQEDWTLSFRTDANTIEIDGDTAWTTEETELIFSGASDEPMDLVQDYDDPESMLYAIHAPANVPDTTTDTLVARMFVSMSHHGGIGLAAPQIGIPRRLFVAVIKGETRAFINPVLMDHAKEMDSFVEGCLSIPSKKIQVLRPIWIEFSYDALDGTLVPFERVENGMNIHARVWLHEFDHINGILALDRQGN